MIYLLDANVLIDSNRDFYPIDRVPEFWEWLLYKAEKGEIKMPEEVYSELKSGNDSLAAWVKTKEVEKVLKFDGSLDEVLLQQVLDNGYGKNLDDTELQIIANDAFLISYALKDKENFTVVTTESSKPKKLRANRHIPDVCDLLGLRKCTAFGMFRELGFRTEWKKSI